MILKLRFEFIHLHASRSGKLSTALMETQYKTLGNNNIIHRSQLSMVQPRATVEWACLPSAMFRILLTMFCLPCLCVDGVG